MAVILVSVETELLYLGVHNCLAAGSTIWSVMVHSSSVTDWLTYFRRRNLWKTNDTSLIQKWIFTCHLEIVGPSHKDQQLRMSVCSPLSGVPVFQFFCLLQEPQPHHPTCHLWWAPGLGRAQKGTVEHHPPKILTSLKFLRVWVAIFEPGE